MAVSLYKKSTDMHGWSWSQEDFTCKGNFTGVAIGQLSLTLG